MTTSGSGTYNPARDIIVNRALRLIGAYSSNDSATPDQKNDAYDVLNAMLKSWQVEGFSWVRCFTTLTLVQAQNAYDLGSTTTDGFVYSGTTTKAARPIKIFNATRKNTNAIEVAVIPINRSDFMAIPNKTTQGRVNQFYYDPQLSMGKLYVWPTPDASLDTLILDVDRPIQDILSDTDTMDFPQEWIEVISYGLASKLAPEYGLSVSEQQLINNELNILRDAVLSYDRGTESLFFQVGRY